jgi:hypothetical protein
MVKNPFYKKPDYDSTPWSDDGIGLTSKEYSMEMILVPRNVANSRNINTRYPYERWVAGIQQTEKGAPIFYNSYAVVNDMKYPQLRGCFYKRDEQGRKYLCGFRADTVPYGNALPTAEITNITYNEYDSAAPVYMRLPLTLVRKKVQNRWALVPIKTTQWVSSVQIPSPIPLD